MMRVAEGHRLFPRLGRACGVVRAAHPVEAQPANPKMNTAPNRMTRVNVLVLWRKIWDMAYLCPCQAAKIYCFASGKQLPSSRKSKEFVPGTSHSYM